MQTWLKFATRAFLGSEAEPIHDFSKNGHDIKSPFYSQKLGIGIPLDAHHLTNGQCQCEAYAHGTY